MTTAATAKQPPETPRTDKPAKNTDRRGKKTGQRAKIETNELACRLVDGCRIKLIGLGGIGCVVLQFLSTFLDHLGIDARLVLIDGDDFERGNLSRMHFQGPGGNKAEVKAGETIDALSCDQLTIATVAEYVTAENVKDLIKPGDIVLLCVDNHPTRRLVSGHCDSLPEVALFSAGNDAVDPPHERGTYGNVQIAIRCGGEDLTAPITRFHPEIAKADGKLPGGPGCGELVASAPQIVFTNLAVGSAMLNAFFAYSCGLLDYQEVKLDIIEGRSLPQFPIDPAITAQFPLDSQSPGDARPRNPK